MFDYRRYLKRFLHKFIYQDWNIAIADLAEDQLTPINIKWMKHGYTDRWFADPFIVEETEEEYIILAEECMHETSRGRIARLTVTKSECKLIKNETVLDLESHLSFPNPIVINDSTYIYPENAAVGMTRYYLYKDTLIESGILSEIPLADPVIVPYDGRYYLLATVGDNCNGNILKVYESQFPLKDYKELQDIEFKDNVARRAGNMFTLNGEIIVPAQICNNDYGEGVSFQKMTVENGKIKIEEIHRLYPLSKKYPEGFHTYNVFGNKKVVIDGYRYGSKPLHNLYFKIRKPKNK